MVPRGSTAEREATVQKRKVARSNGATADIKAFFKSKQKKQASSAADLGREKVRSVWNMAKKPFRK